MVGRIEYTEWEKEGRKRRGGVGGKGGKEKGKELS